MLGSAFVQPEEAAEANHLRRAIGSRGGTQDKCDTAERKALVVQQHLNQYKYSRIYDHSLDLLRGPWAYRDS